jgi:hypothetical protein
LQITHQVSRGFRRQPVLHRPACPLGVRMALTTFRTRADFQTGTQISRVKTHQYHLLVAPLFAACRRHAPINGLRSAQKKQPPADAKGL